MGEQGAASASPGTPARESKPPREMHFETANSAETIEAGRKLAALLPPPLFLILRGDLGAGKTTLVKGIADALHAADPDEVTSPTFTLIHEYVGTRANAGEEPTPVRFYHLDLYRVDAERQLETLGIDELAGENTLVLVEWGEKFPTLVKRSDGEIAMESAVGDTRRVTVRLKR